MRLSTASLAVLAAAVLGAAITARLGWWQLDRAAQKTAIQQALEERRAQQPLPASDLAWDEASAQAQHHRSIALEGRWLPAATVYLENRQMNGHPGFFVVTPLQLDDGTAVLVQRGWQPRDQSDRARVVAPPTPPDRIVVQGRIAPPPARLYEFGADSPGPIRQNLHMAEFARETGLHLRPLSILQEGAAALVASAPAAAASGPSSGSGDGPPDDGLLRQWPAPASGVHKHHGYAFQWFALSALIVCLYVWFQLIRPWQQARRPG
jgi:surfeit locus 1 family protein